MGENPALSHPESRMARGGVLPFGENHPPCYTSIYFFMSMHFGEHLTIDGYGGDKKSLASKELVLSCLNELPGLFGMHKIAEPQLVVFPGNGGKDPGGVSGVVLIAESHISIHTFTERRFLTADVCSCKVGMNTTFIIEYFKKQFGLQDIEDHFIIRGTRYPDKNIA